MRVFETEVILCHDGHELAHVTLPPGVYVIGRSAQVEISANTPLLSRKHARLTLKQDDIFLEDLASTNGTFVADKALTEPTRVLPDQAVRLGTDVTLEIRRSVQEPEPSGSPAPAPATRPQTLPVELLGEERYALGAPISQSDKIVVLDAEETPMRRHVAMKVILDASRERDVHRFVEEAQVVALLDHPNIVPIYELGMNEQGQPFYTMKKVRGITLQKVLDLEAEGVEATARKYPLPALLTIFQKACDAVAFAHAKGVIHRDLKPENIMLGDFGSVLVLGWGLAKVVGGEAAAMLAASNRPSFMTGGGTGGGHGGSVFAGTLMGTPQYMSPEQARGQVEALDTRSDIFALGAVFFQILHLRAFVTGDDPLEIVDKISRGQFDWTSPEKPAPAPLLAVARKALAFDRSQRYSCVEELQRDLNAYQANARCGAEPRAAQPPLKLLFSRHKALSGAVAAALVILATVALGYTSHVAGERRRAEAEAGRAKKALADLRRAAPTLIADARKLIGERKFEEAASNLRFALTIEPENGDAKLLLPEALNAQARAHQAAVESHRVAAVEGQNAWAKVPASPAPSTPAMVAVASVPPPAEKSPEQTAPEAKPPSETEKWLANADAQYGTPFEREVKAPYETAKNEIKQKYLAVLATQLATASMAARLEDSVALRDERGRILGGEGVPRDDSDKPLPALVAPRAAYRAQMGKLEQEHARNAKIHFDRYDKFMAEAQAALTKQQRLDEALVLKKRREVIAKEWLPVAAPPTIAAASAIVKATPPPPLGPASGVKATPQQVAELLFERGVEIFAMEGTKEVRVADAKALAAARGLLTKVILDNVKLSRPLVQEDLKRLAPLKSLRSLEIRGLEIEDDAITFIKQTDALESFTVLGSNLSDAAVNSLVGHPKLKNLKLQGAKSFTGKTLDRLASNRELRSIEFDGTPITDEGAAALGKLTQLETLMLVRSKITDAGMAALGQLTSLTKLNLNNPQVTLKALPGLKGLHKVTQFVFLDANMPEFADAVREAGAAFPKLSTWRLSGDPITATHIETMAQIRSMDALVLSGKLAPTALTGLAKTPGVAKLVLTGDRSDADLEPLTGLHTLKSLEVSGKGVTDLFLERMKRNRGAREIKLLNTSITPQAMASFEKQVVGSRLTR